MSKVTLAAPCVKLYHLLQKLFESAERGTRRPDQYFVVDNGGHLHEKMATGEIKLPPNTIVANPGRPIGAAGAWNLIFRENPDWIVISNDDVELHSTTVEALVHGAETDAEAEFICPEFNAGAMFCVFLQKHSLVDKIGGYDERFFPAYFEDNDYHRRMKLASVKELRVVGASYDHVGSATLKSLSPRERKEHDDNFNRNKNTYIQKWGNVPGLEAHDKPKI